MLNGAPFPIRFAKHWSGLAFRAEAGPNDPVIRIMLSDSVTASTKATE